MDPVEEARRRLGTHQEVCPNCAAWGRLVALIWSNEREFSYQCIECDYGWIVGV